MPTWLRNTLIALAALAALLLVAVAWLIASFDANRYKGLAIDWMRTTHQRTLAIDGPIELSLFPRLALRVAQVRLSEAGRPDEFAAVEAAALAVQVLPLWRGQVMVDRVEARGVRLALLRDAQGRRNVDDLLNPAPPAAPPAGGAASTPAPATSTTFDIHGVELADVTLRLHDAQAGSEGTVQLRQFSTGRLADGVDTPLTFAAHLAFKAPALQGDVSGSARATPQLATGSLRLAGLDLAWQGGGAKPLTARVKGGAAWDGPAKSLGWQLTGRLGADAFRSDGSAALGGARPRLKAQLQFDALDLDAWRSAAAGSGRPAAGHAGGVADAPIDLAPLRRVDATLGLRIGRLALAPYRLTDVHGDAVLDDGLLRVAPLHAQVWGGAVDGSAQVDAGSQRFGLKAVASGIDVAALLRDVASKDALEGRGRVEVDVQSVGRSVQQLTAQLHGSAALQLRDGAVKGINLAKTLREARAALSQRADAAQRASQTEKTDFSELTARFAIDRGIARNDDLALKSPYLRVGGSGEVDLGQRRIDYTARATLIDNSKGQDGGEFSSLRGVTIPVRLVGPFDAVDWQVLWSQVAAGAVKRRLEDTLKERLGLKPAPADASASAPAPRPKDVLRDKLLKGLFNK